MPTTTTAEFAHWLTQPEGSHLEFKTAADTFSKEKLLQYCCALANEGGGKMVLGVTDRIPRQIVGTKAFQNPEIMVQHVAQQLRLRIDYEERNEAGKRVLIFHVPSRPLGMPLSCDKIRWMRAGESLTDMTDDLLRRIYAEAGPDHSAEICPNAQLSDLDPASIAEFRTRWITKSGNQALAQKSDAELLTDAELILGADLTYAAMILFGTRQALGRLRLAQAEVVFEYRSSLGSIPYQQRLEFRQGFFSFYDQLWTALNTRNDLQSYQSGLFRYDIPTFSEIVVREALLNAISHRDYRLGGSIFVKQFPRHLEIISPGGFPPGITQENLLSQQNPRNRRIAETFAKCGLIERSGQGMNRIYEETIRQSKPLPDFSGSADHEVRLVLHGEIQDPQFVIFIQKIAPEILAAFTTQDWLVLDLLQRSQPLPPAFRIGLPRLIDWGLVESIGKGRGVRHFLSHALYSHLGERGTYTRKLGLDRDTNKELLVKHIQKNAAEGSPLADLQQVLPALSRDQIQTLLRELKEDGRILSTGRGSGAIWLPAPTQRSIP